MSSPAVKRRNGLTASLVGITVLLAACSAGRLSPAGPVAGTANVEEGRAVRAGGAAPELQKRLAELENTLHQKERELQELRLQLARIEHRGDALKQAGDAEQEQSLENLRQELRAERAQREALVRELEALRREVASPFGENQVPEREYLALKEELMDLRRRFDELARERQALLEVATSTPKEPLPSKGDPLAAEQERLAADLRMDLDASEARIAELEAQLAMVKEQAQRSAMIESENSTLRAQLAEERRRAEALEAKLKVAARVTELIFRMRSENRPEQRPPQ